MLSDAWFLARKDVQYMLRTRETLFWTFVMPVVFFFFIGSITGGGGGGGSSDQTPLVIEAAPGAGFLVHHLESRLEKVGFRVLPPPESGVDPRMLRIRIGEGFTDSVLAGHAMPLTMVREEQGLRGDYDDFRVKRAVFMVIGDLIAATDGTTPPTEEGLSILVQAPPIISVRTEAAGFRKDHPEGFEQAVPGTMVMFTLLVMLSSGAILLVIERNEGLLRRLASSPLTRTTIILGKWGGRLMVGLIQIAWAMLVGTLLFHMDWGPNVPMLLVVLVFYAGVVALLGIILGSLARTPAQSIGIGILTANVLAALGGCWWPIEVTPEWMQRLALALPTGWAMDALHKLVSFGAGPVSVLPHLLVFAVAGVVAARVSARVFRFQ
jgi:ABC-type multidrug transport system permease subunit